MILISYGTRPEQIKVKPLITILQKNGFSFKLLFTGQHQNIVEFGSDYSIDIINGVNRLDSIISYM